MRVKITRVEIVEVYFRPPDPSAEEDDPNINLEDFKDKLQDDILNSQETGIYVGIDEDYNTIPKELVELKVEEVPE